MTVFSQIKLLSFQWSDGKFVSEWTKSEILKLFPIYTMGILLFFGKRTQWSEIIIVLIENIKTILKVTHVNHVTCVRNSIINLKINWFRK